MHWPISVWTDKRMHSACLNNKFEVFYPIILAEGFMRDMDETKTSCNILSGAWKWGYVDYDYIKRHSTKVT